MIYLASPYSHPEASVRQRRFEQVCGIAAGIIRGGELVYSPIAHSHPIAVYGSLPENDTEYWARLNLAWMRACRELRVACMEGWRESQGIQREIGMADAFGLPVSFIEIEGAA